MVTTKNRSIFSCQTDMSTLVKSLTEQFKDIWWDSKTTMPEFRRAYTQREQQENEAMFRRYLSVLDAEAKKMSQGEAERQMAKDNIRQATIDFARNTLEFEDRHMDALLSYGFVNVAAEFIHASRQYDPALTDADIFQATRNVWSMNLMQLLMGLPIRMTPSVFAYSLLYPYSDNYLDDPNVPIDDKLSFNDRLRRRLEGQMAPPANAYEETIADLIGRIEAEFDRQQYPEVYQSLLAIHVAQSKSLRLLHRGASPYEIDVLGICFEKGGASVLADGYLVAGQLNDAQRELTFSYGTFTQLIDDLEDVQADIESGLNTIYSQTARHWPLDTVTNRAFHFWAQIRKILDRFESQRNRPLIEIIDKYVPVLLIAEAGIARQFYSRPYIKALEAHCPFRFSFLIKERRRLEKRKVSPLGLIEALAG